MPIVIDVVFAAFKDGLFRCSHFLSFSSSAFNDFVISSMLLETYAKLVSSAYMLTLES